MFIIIYYVLFKKLTLTKKKRNGIDTWSNFELKKIFAKFDFDIQLCFKRKISQNKLDYMFNVHTHMHKRIKLIMLLLNLVNATACKLD